MPNPLNIELNSETRLFDQTKMKLGVNLADKFTEATQQKIWMYVLEQYVRPQIDARRPYEKMWDILYDAYRMRLKLSNLKLRPDEKKFVEILKERMSSAGVDDLPITDSLIFDTVDRLSNLTHYITWKDGQPVQFGTPEDFSNPLQDMMYNPLEQKNKSQNAVLSWSIRKEKAYTKSREMNRDYYLYGFAYGISDFYFQLKTDGENIILKDVGISYEPTSVRKVWLDWRVPISKMDQQPCPFWFDMVPVFKILGNQYDPVLNPMGYLNLDKVYESCKVSDAVTYFYGGESWLEPIKKRLESVAQGLGGTEQYTKIKAKWTFFPVLPLDPSNGDFEVRGDGKTPVPFRRFCIEVWSSDLISNKIVMLRCQDVEDHYEGQLPIYGATHLADLSSAAYSMSICEALINSAIEITLCTNYAIENKNLINHPPTQHITGSPSLNQDVNRPDAKIEVYGANDFAWRTVPDATQTTMGIRNGIRQDAQATGRVTESLLGRALGGRTTALEAGNLFETSMSQITTDINILNEGFHGSFGERVFTAYTKWLDPHLVKLITGQYGWPVDAIDHRLQISMRTDVGSRYMNSIRKQQQIQYMLQAAVQSPVLDQTILWKEYTVEVGMPQLQKAIIDQGRDRDIARAQEQCYKTYLDEPVVIDPGQNHEIAMQVKIRFIENTESDWNKRYGSLPYMGTNNPRVQVLAAQVQLHQNYILMQQQMAAQLQMQQASLAIQEQQEVARLEQQSQQRQQSNAA